MTSSEAFTDCSLEWLAFSTKGFHNVSYFYMDFLQYLVLTNQLIAGRPSLSFRIDMAKSSSFLTWSTLSVTAFSFNMLECSSLSGRYSSKCSFSKEAIDFDILYLCHSSPGTTLNLLISGLLSDESLSDVVLVADEEEEEYVLFLFIFLLFGNFFSS